MIVRMGLFEKKEALRKESFVQYWLETHFFPRRLLYPVRHLHPLRPVWRKETCM